MNAKEFVKFLIQEKVIPTGTAKGILEAVSISGDHVDTLVLDLGLASERVMLTKLGQFTMSRTVSANELMSAPPELTALIPRRLAQRFGLIPFARDGKTLWVGAVDPGNLLVEDELGLLTGSMIKTFAALEVRVRHGLAQHYEVPLTARLEGLGKRLDTLDSVARTPPAPHAKREFPQTRKRTAPRFQDEKLEKPEEPKPRATVPTELEISDEELALYPSFALEDTQTPPSRPVPPSPKAPQVGSPTDDPAATQPTHPAEGAREKETALSPEVRLAHASEALLNAEIRDDIGDALLKFCCPLFDRRMLFAVRGETLIGWRGEGAGVEPTAVRAIAIPKEQPSVFSGLFQGSAFWLGPLPAMARNQELTFALGSPDPAACLILPIKVRSKIVGFLYGDCCDRPLGSIPMADLKRLMAKTDIAFQVYLLKGKIRVI